MLMLEHMDQLSENAARAIANIKFDKVIVWDGGGQSGGTSGFLQGLARSLPPVMNIMKDIGGIEMPEYFGKIVAELDAKKATNDKEPAPVADADKKGNTGGKPPPLATRANKGPLKSGGRKHPPSGR